MTPAQLETARELQQEFGLEFPLIEASAEAGPARRVVRSRHLRVRRVDLGRPLPVDPGGRTAAAAAWGLVFLLNSALVILCSPDEGPAVEQLVRPQFGMHRFEDWDGVEFHLSHGDWIRLLRANGFEILDLIEIQAPPEAETHEYYDYVTADWARQWPAEEIWKARKS